MYKHFTKLGVLTALVIGCATASATVTYNYDRGPGVFGGNSQLSYDSVAASYDTGTEEFSFIVDYNGTAADGGWLVISPGPNPKHSGSELGIAYFDRDSGDTWIYAYNGMNNSASYQTMDFLGYFDSAYTTVNGTATLAFDASSINSVLETGFAFGDRIGIWFHPSANLTVSGDANGLSLFSAQQNGWLDTNFDGDCANPNNGCITSVPEPGTALLLLAGLAILFYSQYRQRQTVAASYAELSARIDRQLYAHRRTRLTQ